MLYQAKSKLCACCVVVCNVVTCKVRLCHCFAFESVYLLRVSLSEGQFGGHVKHDLLLPVDSVDGLGTCLTVGHVQTPTKPAQRQEGGGSDSDFMLDFKFLHPMLGSPGGSPVLNKFLTP